MSFYDAAGAEIARLRSVITKQVAMIAELRRQLDESGRQRATLSEYIETLARGGIEAAVGAGK
jgi:hypothetical protein